MRFGFAVVQLDVTVVNVALKTIGASFHRDGGIAGLQWVVNAYTVVFASLILTADRKESGAASGVLNTTRQIGSVVGVALFGSLIADQHRFAEAMHLALYISAVAVLIGAAAALILIREPEAAQYAASNRARPPDRYRASRSLDRACHGFAIRHPRPPSPSAGICTPERERRSGPHASPMSRLQHRL